MHPEILSSTTSCARNIQSKTLYLLQSKGGITMAEKAERILYIVQKLDGRFVGENRMTRQEAIERMAKALVEYEKTNNPNACEWNDLKERAKDIYRERAEAALNALLEKGK